MPGNGLALRLVRRRVCLAAGAAQGHVTRGALVSMSGEVAARADTCPICVTSIVGTENSHVLIKQEVAWGEVTPSHEVVAKVRRGYGLGGLTSGLVTWPVLLLTRGGAVGHVTAAATPRGGRHPANSAVPHYSQDRNCQQNITVNKFSIRLQVLSPFLSYISWILL